MLASIFKSAAIILVTLGYTLVVFLSRPFDRRGRWYYPLARSWSKALLAVCGVRLQVHGGEHLRKDENYIYVSNHASYFDIPILLAGLRDSVRIMYKRELEKIPIFGWQLALSPFIAIDRSNPREGMASIDKAIDSMREGTSVLVFPEGTRSENGTLGPFKRGAFMLAARAQRPIVPVGIVGSHSILAKSGAVRISSGTVHLVVAQPVQALEAPDSRREKELMQDVHAKIAALLARKH